MAGLLKVAPLAVTVELCSCTQYPKCSFDLLLVDEKAAPQITAVVNAGQRREKVGNRVHNVDKWS